jgi:hypothetical protein
MENEEIKTLGTIFPVHKKIMFLDNVKKRLFLVLLNCVKNDRGFQKQMRVSIEMTCYLFTCTDIYN